MAKQSSSKAGPNAGPNAGMNVNIEADENLLLIQSYGGGGFKLQERRVQGAMIVTGEGYYPLEADSVTDLSLEKLSPVAGETLPEILLIGSGKQMAPLARDFRLDLEKQRIPFDVMDTGAAARTYNILLLEGRRVMAMLLPVD